MTNQKEPSSSEIDALVKSLIKMHDLALDKLKHLPDPPLQENTPMTSDMPPLAEIPPDFQIYQAAETLRDYAEPGVKDADLDLYVTYLQRLVPPPGTVDTVSCDTLFLQAHVLDVLFNKVLQKASLNHVRDMDMNKIRTALLAQKQSRHTLESFREARADAQPTTKNRAFMENLQTGLKDVKNEQ